MRMDRRLGIVFLGFVAGQAHAQSSVTLYGLIDEGLMYTNSVQTSAAPGAHNGKSQVALVDGASGIGGTRWGITGAEDLGGGLKAIFTLENGFNINTGGLAQGGLMFGRQAFVGLSAPMGTVTVGRQYNTMTDFVFPTSVAGLVPGHMGAHPDDIDDLGHSQRINNTIKFKSATFHGFTVGGMYGLGGVAGNFTGKQFWSGAVSYASGPLTVAAGYTDARNPNLSYFGTGGTSGPATSNNMGSIGSATEASSNPVFSGYASARSLRIAEGGARYQIGDGTVGATFSHINFANLGDLTSGPNPLGFAGSAIFNDVEINGGYSFGPAFQVAAAYDYLHGSSVSGKAGPTGGVTYHQGLLSAAYFLSKRTELYAIAIYQKATGKDSLNQPAVASITGVSPSATDHQAVVRLGIIHRF
ncbi:porin [Paraburkholderia silvatlantica]|uniref:Porin n=1 Tax=Paraburkholderia silvatlantica TaxID=321895 RepID=A0ABR6FPP7_9BURK|nr:porin [Paraburkholderia silvatlantica]MBB2929403.1 putative porin [Paraburkholderia silvatlantica]PVY35905.1 putative porin [Paraburkholderia silvatlantica]PXW39853.1 putative porin [Paraburkholderia silvatlantica]TDQ99476.1 putative porin [Paraburkholderia silvatlantica]